jgi:AraC family transcriptional regulator
MFFAIIGVTPAEYARRRRLTLAARELTSTNAKVIDIGLKYGYDSPDSFTRAFRNIHGITPQAARAPGVTLAAFPRVSFNIILKGGNDMDYKIIDRPAFDVVGRGKKFTTAGGTNFIKIPQFWQEFSASAEYQKLAKLGGGKPGPVTGADIISAILPNEKNTWDPIIYTICIEKTGKTADFDVFHIPAATWAVFESIGPMPGAIQEVTRKIFQEWFPSTGYEHDAKPELEVYLPGDPNSKDYRCQVWMPIVKKKKK